MNSPAELNNYSTNTHAYFHQNSVESAAKETSPCFLYSCGTGIQISGKKVKKIFAYTKIKMEKLKAQANIPLKPWKLVQEEFF